MASALTPEQITDMLADLAAGAEGDVFTPEELQRLYDRADGDYNTAVYYGWRQIAANATKWVNYRVAQTHVNRGDAFKHIQDMLTLWGGESASTNQVLIMGAVGVPTKHKPKPGQGKFSPRYRGRGWPNA